MIVFVGDWGGILWKNESFVRKKEMKNIARDFYKISKYFYDATNKKSKDRFH